MYKEKNLKDMKHSLISLQAEYEWLENVDSCILRPSLEDLTKAYKNYFAKRSLYPKFKSKNNCNSYRTNCIKSSYKDSNYSNLILDKCLWYNKKLIKIASYYASSQIYNKC